MRSSMKPGMTLSLRMVTVFRGTWRPMLSLKVRLVITTVEA